MLQIIFIHLVYAQLRIPSWHPKIETVLGTTPMANHPPIHQRLAQVSNNFQNRRHPNVDDLIRGGTGLPNGHPPISSYLNQVGIDQNLKQTVPQSHPDVDSSYGKTQLPAGHPSVDSFFRSSIPQGHPNIDSLLQNPRNLPQWHPKLDQFLKRQEAVASPIPPPSPSPTSTPETNQDNDKNNSSIPSKEFLLASIPHWHPKLSKESLSTQKAMPRHLRVHYLFEKELAKLSFEHPNIDDLIHAGNIQLPLGHPDLYNYITTRNRFNTGHILSIMVACLFVIALLIKLIAMAFKKTTNEESRILNEWEWQSLTSSKTGGIFEIGEAVNRDRRIQNARSKYLQKKEDYWTDTPGTLNKIVAESRRTLNSESSGKRYGAERPQKSPSGSDHSIPSERSSRNRTDTSDRRRINHNKPRSASSERINQTNSRTRNWIETNYQDSPRVGRYPERVVKNRRSRSLENTLFDSISRKSSLPSEREDQAKLSTSRTTIGKLNMDGNSIFHEPGRQSRSTKKPSPLRNQFKRNRDKKDERPLYAMGSVPPRSKRVESFLLPKKENNNVTSIRQILNERIPRTGISKATGIFLVVYIVLNMIAVFVTQSFSGSAHKRSDIHLDFGSLAAANTMLLIIPATRNSILTWFLGLSFQNVLGYHRWLGRWMITCVVIHGICRIPELLQTPLEFVHWTGLAGAGFGLIIVVTSLDVIRRNYFNSFYWLHYSFIGFFFFSYIHVREIRPFLWTAMALYGLDRVIRILSTSIPRKTVVFKPKGSNVCQVRFKKPWGKHKIGQYYFVNFPKLSLVEWHPFSVSSGPREDCVEFHIRAIGDHTRKIFRHSEDMNMKNSQTTVRIDGPYGGHQFNYRRFPVVCLISGGIGFTPMLAMLKDIYNVGEYSEREQRKIIPHRMKSVVVLWAVRDSEDALCFQNEIDECLRNSNSPQFPNLEVHIYVTKGNPVGSMKAGRPDFDKHYNRIILETKSHLKSNAVLTMACGPKKMIEEVTNTVESHRASGVRMDLHCESFEF